MHTTTTPPPTTTNNNNDNNDDDNDNSSSSNNNNDNNNDNNNKDIIINICYYLQDKGSPERNVPQPNSAKNRRTAKSAYFGEFHNYVNH